MINGEYIMVVAPSDYPYKKYRGKYCYEHILNYWLAYGEIPEGSHIHHKDENKHNNNPENLEALNRNEHIILHNTTGRTTIVLKCPACGLIFEREKRNTHLIEARRAKYTACSRACSGKFSHVLDKREGILENVVEIYKK